MSTGAATSTTARARADAARAGDTSNGTARAVAEAEGCSEPANPSQGLAWFLRTRRQRWSWRAADGASSPAIRFGVPPSHAMTSTGAPDDVSAPGCEKRTTSSSPSASSVIVAPSRTPSAMERASDARLDLSLDVAAQRPGAIDRVVTTSRDQLARDGTNTSKRKPPISEPCCDVVYLQVDDLLDLLERQRLEQHDLVDAVEELGTEVARAARPSRASRASSADLAIVESCPSSRYSEPMFEVMMTTVLRKLTVRPCGVGQPAVVEDLQ